MNQEQLSRHRCHPGERFPEYDARGIFLCYVCEACRASKLSGYRPEVLLDPNYQADEDIDEEPSVINADEWQEETMPPDYDRDVFEPEPPLYVRKPSGRYRVAEPDEVVSTALSFAVIDKGTAIRSPKDTETFLHLKLGHLEHEVFALVYLDNRHKVIAFEELFRGTIDGTAVYPREVIKSALKHNAAAIVLAHNHPSGVAEPSQADERITKRIKAACELVDIRLLDHLIIGGGKATSLAERGVL